MTTHAHRTHDRHEPEGEVAAQRIPENGAAGCEHGKSLSEFCSDCVGWNPVTCSPACDWCAEPACGFCVRQGAPIPPGATARENERGGA